jgi:hypothetical protein
MAARPKNLPRGFSVLEKSRARKILHLRTCAIMRFMRQAQGPAHWTGNPPLSRRWPGSALHALAMFVLHAVSFLKMLFSRNARECHAEPAPQALPDAKRGNLIEEASPAEAAIDAAIGMTPTAMMLALAEAANVQPHSNGVRSHITRTRLARSSCSSCTRLTPAAAGLAFTTSSAFC